MENVALQLNYCGMVSGVRRLLVQEDAIISKLLRNDALYQWALLAICLQHMFMRAIRLN